MFKYKSPLSRLLEGAGKTKETEAGETSAEPTENPEPIADLNALRQALGGEMSADGYEDAEELIPEDKMPDFDDDTASAAEAETPVEDAVQDEQIVTLHIGSVEVEKTIDQVVATVVDPAPAATAQPEQDEIAEPEIEPAAAEPEQDPEPAADTQSEAAPEPAEDRRARVKTTFLGFERPDTHVQDMIETADPVAKAETSAEETFPVGWLVVTGGPGRGASITLKEGLMQIGRNDDQAIQLDFGDTGISRSNHAVIAYDPEDRKCYLGHGGKANLVRLNGKPVLSTVPLSGGDLIRISETSIRFIPFCDENFDWRDA